MAYVHRLIFCVLVALSAWVPGSSFASTLPATVPALPRYDWTNWSGLDKQYASAAAACSSYGSSDPLATFGLAGVIRADDIAQQIWCDYSRFYPGANGDPGYTAHGHAGHVDSYSRGVTYYCEDPANYELSPDGGICTLRAQSEAAKCTAVNGGVDLFTGSAYRPVGGAYCPNTGSGKGCASTVTGGYATVKDGVKTWLAEVTYDGSTCTPPVAGSGTASDVPTTCKGQTGTVNGVAVCIPFSPSNPPAQVVTGSTSTSADGVVTSTVTDTACNGANCTTTATTTVGAGGGSGGTGTGTTATTTKTDPQPSFCADNPASPMCKTSSYSGGACGSVPSCDGDAIQCAIAAASFKSSCAYDNSAALTTEENRYTSAKAVTGDQSVDTANPLGFAVTPGSFDRTNLLGAEVGLSDLAVTVMGRTTTLPFSGLNTWFAVLGNILMGCTALLCMRIVARG